MKRYLRLVPLVLIVTLFFGVKSAFASVYFFVDIPFVGTTDTALETKSTTNNPLVHWDTRTNSAPTVNVKLKHSTGTLCSDTVKLNTFSAYVDTPLAFYTPTCGISTSYKLQFGTGSAVGTAYTGHWDQK